MSNQKKRQIHRGFTLLECLFALLILSGFLLLTNGTIQHHKQLAPLLMRRNRQEFEVFLIQLENELQERTFEKSTATEINFKTHVVDTVPSVIRTTIKVQNEMIIKNENGGYHPLLVDVKKVLFHQTDTGIDIKVWFFNGDINYGKWIFPKT
ncbi:MULTISPECIES: competence type IV pilus minor pilin ComGF [Enterococcus]|uniref:competence type IV pilus minor pilin ComGF n=1 Tax=Enterococcus TaxID=1350 RepID=UPI0010F9C547|nr:MULTISPECIES: competence type IV pilus minor pilin ComGF [Enterococcus]